nr:DUF2807 domain-containing protein [Candidatus Kapabacteria bacterium]
AMIWVKRSVLLVVISIVISGCDFFCSTEDDSIISEKRKLPEYSKINIVEPDTYVNLKQSSTADFTIFGTSTILKNLMPDVRDGELNIEMYECESTHKKININIDIKTVSSICSRANSVLTAQSPIESEIIELNLTADGEITIEDLFANKIDAIVSGSGNINIGGKKNIKELIINIDGSGNVNTYNLPVENITVNISGSGSCKINPISSLKARISGTGNIYYKGDPEKTIVISGSGEVIKN